MSTAIVLPTLTQWVENHITAVAQAKTQADLQDAVDAFLSKNATIVINGTQITQAQYVAQIAGEHFDEQSATVTFTASVAAPATAGDNFTAGSVGVSFNEVIVEGIRVLGAPVTKQVSVSLNVVIAQDPSIPKPPTTPIHGFFDGRRVMALNEVVAQVQETNTIPSASS